MLNWIWLGLIVIAIAVATGTDISELSQDRFRNGKPITFNYLSQKQISPDHFSAEALTSRKDLQKFYDPSEVKISSSPTLIEDTVHIMITGVTNGAASFAIPQDAPKI